MNEWMNQYIYLLLPRLDQLHFLRYYSTSRRSIDGGGSPYQDVGGVMAAAARPGLVNHGPEKMAPSFNLLPRLARVMGSVLPQLGRQNFSSASYFGCPILNGLFSQFPNISGGFRKLIRLSPEIHGLLNRWSPETTLPIFRLLVRPSFPGGLSGAGFQ